MDLSLELALILLDQFIPSLCCGTVRFKSSVDRVPDKRAQDDKACPGLLQSQDQPATLFATRICFSLWSSMQLLMIWTTWLLGLDLKHKMCIHRKLATIGVSELEAVPGDIPRYPEGNHGCEIYIRGSVITTLSPQQW